MEGETIAESRPALIASLRKIELRTILALEDKPKLTFEIPRIKWTSGCLSFINMNINNLDIKSNNSNCEDSINFINVNGKIDSLTAINSFSDALDVDFSKLKFNNINIKSARNDCADFSSGDYELGIL